MSPSALAHVSARSRSNAAVTAKQEAKKRVLEEKTAAKVASLRKKVSIVYSSLFWPIITYYIGLHYY